MKLPQFVASYLHSFIGFKNESSFWTPQTQLHFTHYDICIGNSAYRFRQNLPLMGNILPDGVQKIITDGFVFKFQV
ncbi:adenylosuccinate synthetase [Vibrionales bacterium SWAT-3]|nr:adenylosuccinate synthetase [Vibrionales bacterium SWAT-3]